MQLHKYSLFEIENLIPWERDIYVEQLRHHIEEVNLKSLQNELVQNQRRKK